MAICSRAPPSYFTFRAERGALVAALDDVLDETEAALGEAAVARRDGALLLRVRRGDCILDW